MYKMDDLKVSVVIPTLQEGKYIGKLLSRLSKINPRLEIIVIDGGSTDETVSIAKKLADKVYVLRERGIGKARNYGAYKSNGEIIVFMDADIDPPPNFLKKIISVFNKKNVVGATCNIMPKNPSPFEYAFFRFYNLLLRLFAHFKPHSRGEFLVVRRNAFFKVGGFNEHLPCLEDHELVFRLSKIGKFIFLNDLIVYESMRRFRRMGFLKVLKLWISNYISLVLIHKTISRSWEPVR